ncbi:MAG: hypothetical protein GY679_02060 [Mycoplasma sp.]|nr:hypothetical protein [Mycoplasma sp.]
MTKEKEAIKKLKKVFIDAANDVALKEFKKSIPKWIIDNHKEELNPAEVIENFYNNVKQRERRSKDKAREKVLSLYERAEREGYTSVMQSKSFNKIALIFLRGEKVLFSEEVGYEIWKESKWLRNK